MIIFIFLALPNEHIDWRSRNSGKRCTSVSFRRGIRVCPSRSARKNKRTLDFAVRCRYHLFNQNIFKHVINAIETMYKMQDRLPAVSVRHSRRNILVVCSTCSVRRRDVIRVRVTPATSSINIPKFQKLVSSGIINKRTLLGMLQLSIEQSLAPSDHSSDNYYVLF